MNILDSPPRELFFITGGFVKNFQLLKPSIDRLQNLLLLIAPQIANL